MLARVLVARGDMRGAAEQLHQVPVWWTKPDTSPAKPEALYIEGHCYLNLGLARKAEDAWKACVEGEPLHRPPVKYLADADDELIKLYVLEDRIDEAREAI